MHPDPSMKQGSATAGQPVAGGSLLRRLYHLLPPGLRQRLTPLSSLIRLATDREYREREAWLRDEYGAAGLGSRNSILLAAARFLHINRPISGYYFEFGCHSAQTMRMAWRNSRYLFNWTYVAFDSFEGLPEIQDVDRQEIWGVGRLKTAEDEFIETVTGAGMPRERLITVKGFYDKSLNGELSARLLPEKAAVIYVDCDLYASTVPVLKFIRPFLQPGTIIVFDDWNCFIGDPEKGERRAWAEFRASNPGLRFESFVATSEAQSFIFLGEQANAEPSPDTGRAQP